MIPFLIKSAKDLSVAATSPLPTSKYESGNRTFSDPNPWMPDVACHAFPVRVSRTTSFETVYRPFCEFKGASAVAMAETKTSKNNSFTVVMWPKSTSKIKPNQ